MKSTYVVLALGLLALAFAAPAVAGSAEKMLPEDTIFVLSVDNFTESHARLKAHPLYALYSEPDFQKFIEKPLAKINEMMESSAVKPGEMIKLIQGQATVAVTGAREVANLSCTSAEHGPECHHAERHHLFLQVVRKAVE